MGLILLIVLVLLLLGAFPRWGYNQNWGYGLRPFRHPRAGAGGRGDSRARGVHPPWLLMGKWSGFAYTAQLAVYFLQGANHESYRTDPCRNLNSRPARRRLRLPQRQ